MPLTPLAAGEKPTAGRFNGLYDITRTVYQAGDQIATSTTNVLSNYLILPLAVNSVYAFEASIFYDTNSAADFFMGLTLPAGATTHISWWAQLQADSATNSPIVHSEAANVGAGGVASGTVMTMRPVGSIFTAGTAGNMQVVFSQSTTTAINTILKTGSWIRLTKVA